MKNCFTICVDMDDTIENLLPAWLDYLNKKYNKQVKVEDVTAWEMDKIYSDLNLQQILEPLDQLKFWKTVKPKADAVYYLKKLAEEHQDIYICTNSHYTTIAPKFEKLIKEYFPFISWDQFIVIKNKQMIKCDIMIDDAAHNLEGADCYKILIDAPYNRVYDEKKENMLRVASWKEIYDIIHHLDWFYSFAKKRTIDY